MPESSRGGLVSDQGRSEASGRDLADLFGVLWKWRWVVGGVTALSFVLTAVVTLLSPVVYEASVLLLVSPSKIPAPDATQAAPAVTPETFVTILQSRAVAIEVIKRFGLERAPHNITPERFLSNVLSVKVNRGTNLLVVAVTLRDPQLAADVVNFVAEKVVALNAQVNQGDAISTQEYLRAQRDQTDRALQTAEAALTDFRRSANLEGLRADEKVMLQERARITEELARVTTLQVGEEARVQEFRSALQKQEQVLTLRKSIVSDPAALAAVQEQGETRLRSLAALELRTEEVNTLYQDVLRNLITSETELAAFSRQRSDLERKLSVNERRLIKIEADIATAESKFEALKRAATLAAAAYSLITKKVDEAALSVIARTTDLKLVDRAIPASEPVRRLLLLKLALGLSGGLIVATLLALSLEYTRGRSRTTLP